MKNNYITTFILLLSFTPCLASDCMKISKAEVFHFADIVFLGEVIEVMDTSYNVKVLESYKGNSLDTLIGIINQNVIVPEKGSIWLFYAIDLGNSTFIANSCSGSKSFNFPHGAHDISSLIPPPPDVMKAPAQLFVLEQILKDKALNELYFEISSLRHQKLHDRIENLEATNKVLENQLGQTSQYNKIIAGLVGLLILLQIFFILQKYKK